MGFDDGPDPLAPGLLQAFGGEAEPGGDLPFAANPPTGLVVGFHSSRRTMSPVAVQQTGRLMACIWSKATRTPSGTDSDSHRVTVCRTNPDAAARVRGREITGSGRDPARSRRGSRHRST